MAPKISSFPRRIFYDGSLLDGPNVLSPDYGLELNLAITSTFRYFQVCLCVYELVYWLLRHSLFDLTMSKSNEVHPFVT